MNSHWPTAANRNHKGLTTRILDFVLKHAAAVIGKIGRLV